jgi:hypothetical protein
MAYFITLKSKHSPMSKRAAGIALSAVLILGAIVASASAQGYRGDRHGFYHGGDRGGWNGGYYAAPPVVYGGPYYAPPPVVYAPGVTVVVPGIGINIR